MEVLGGWAALAGAIGSTFALWFGIASYSGKAKDEADEIVRDVDDLKLAVNNLDKETTEQEKMYYALMKPFRNVQGWTPHGQVFGNTVGCHGSALSMDSGVEPGAVGHIDRNHEKKTRITKKNYT